MITSRPWGSYEVIGEGPNYQVKRLMVKPGARLSLQSHKLRSEHWTVVGGTGVVEINDHKSEVGYGDHSFISTGSKHRLTNTGTTLLVVVEVQCGPYLGEDDITRYEDDYGRVQGL